MTKNCWYCQKLVPGPDALFSERAKFCSCDKPVPDIDKGTVVEIRATIDFLKRNEGKTTAYVTVDVGAPVGKVGLEVDLELIQLTCGHSIMDLTGDSGHQYCQTCYANSR